MNDITKLENELALLNAARYADGPHKGHRVVERDPAYRRDVFAKQTQLAEMKQTEKQTVRLHPDQNAGLTRQLQVQANPDVQRLQSAMGAKNPATGRRWVEDKPALRGEIERGLASVIRGGRFTMSPDLEAAVRQPK